jgi:hypothetical protein
MADKDYIKLILAHIGIGFCIFLFPFLAKIYAFLIVSAGLYFVIKNRNKNNEALYAAAYILGSEVLLRATSGNPLYEFGKYFVLLFIILAIIYDQIPKRTNPYWLYLLLLIPGVISAIDLLNDYGKPNISFNISGPLCLGICCLYTYKRKISVNSLHTILLAIGMPILAFVSYLFLKCPLTNFEIYNTESNYLLSGDHAPNQTATILGLGMIVFTIRLFLVSSSKKIVFLNIFITAYIYYRTLLTFSRGGAITAVAVILVFFFVLLLYYQHKGLKAKIGSYILVLIAGFWLTSFQTDTLLFKRYAEQNLNGNPKQEEDNSRRKIAIKEIDLFKKNPLLGVGVGEGTVIRKSESGLLTTSHSEMTRMMAEHGVFGILSLLILIITPLLLFLKNKQNIYMICFLAFWALTINHSAMRIAAPAFLYALALMSVQKEEEVNLA